MVYIYIYVHILHLKACVVIVWKMFRLCTHISNVCNTNLYLFFVQYAIALNVYNTCKTEFKFFIIQMEVWLLTWLATKGFGKQVVIIPCLIHWYLGWHAFHECLNQEYIIHAIRESVQLSIYPIQTPCIKSLCTSI